MESSYCNTIEVDSQSQVCYDPSDNTVELFSTVSTGVGMVFGLNPVLNTLLKAGLHGFDQIISDGFDY